MLTHVARNVLRRPLRSVLTMAGIAIGGVAYLTLVAMSHGMRDQAQRAVDLLGGDLTIMRAGSSMPWMSSITRAEAEKLRAIDGVASVSEVVIGTTRAGPRSVFVVLGADPRQGLFQRFPLTDGRLLREGTTEMIIGDAAAAQLDVGPGDAVELGGVVLEVVGVFHTGRGVLDAACALDLALAQRLFGSPDQVNLAFVSLASADATPEVLRAIHERLPRVEAAPSAVFTSRFDYLDLVTAYARWFATLAVLIAAVMIANTIGMNVAERRKEIAILRAVGWSPVRIAVLVVGEGTLLILAGTALAIPASAIGLRMLSVGDAAWAVPPSLPPFAILEAFALALAAGIAFAAIPAAHALRARPAEALRMP